MESYGASCEKRSRLAAGWHSWDRLERRGSTVLNRPHREDRPAAGQPVIAAASPWFKGGGAGWLALGVLVVAWDLIAPETLSEAFRRARSGRIGSAVVVVVWASLTGHLFHVIPDRADPFVALCVSGRKAVKRGSGQARN